jgi:uncharacterized repeat protein (TIGR01451 family)
MKKYFLISFSCLLVFYTAPVDASQTLLYFKSTPGDYIGQGEEKLYDQNITVERNYDNGVSFSVDYDMEWWNLDFAAPYSETLAEGVYENATRFPFQSVSQPGLSLYGSGRGCNELYGRFEVLEAVYDGSGNVISFAADFEQHCEHLDAPPLYGVIRYNSEIPFTIPTTTTTIAALYFKSTPGDYIGQGEEKLYTENISGERNYDNGVSFSVDYGSEWWYLDFAAPYDQTLVEGVYENATRFPFQSSSQPGLSFSGSGRGCNTLYGRFEVLEAVYDGSGNVISFAADFEQHCGQPSAPPLYGAIRYNSEIPITVPTTTTTSTPTTTTTTTVPTTTTILPTTTTTGIFQETDMLISLGVDKTLVRMGDLLTYTITVKNFGPGTAANVVVNDILPASTTFYGASSKKGHFTTPPKHQNGSVTWYVGEMPAEDQENAQLTVTVIIKGKSTITNVATLMCDTPDPNSGNNTASILVNVLPGSSGGKTTTTSIPDTDSDGIPDNVDNCPTICNVNQHDADGEGIGDVCDTKPGCGGCGQPQCEQPC